MGGRLAAPMYITEGEPYRPDIILWLELPEGLIVGSAIVHPAESRAAFGESLRAAMQRPMIGPPRHPDRIRVADPSLADDVRVALGEGISLSVAPTPELNAVLREMAQAGAIEGEEPESYLEGGRVPPRAVEDLFRAANLLFEIAPWKVADDDQVLRVDIPELGVDGACLSIIGALGESFGIILFPSLAGYEAFAAAGPAAGAEGAIDLGTALLSLSFERGADVPPAMRREVAEHGWPVTGAQAYPRVALRERHGLLRPLTEKDVRIVTACAASLCAFFVKHRELFGSDSFIPVCESYSDRNDLTVRFTVPYDAGALFEIEEPPPRASISRARVGRNDPCPCGSGKKYKKCHLGAEPTGARGRERIETIHERDARLVGSIFDWASRRFGAGWANPLRDAKDKALVAQLLAPWCAYHASIDGRRVAELFGEARGPGLSVEDRAWLSSQCDAWLSIWEVAEVEPGAEVRVVDLLTGETRSVRELSGSKTLVKRDAMLARVVDYSGISLFCGTHPRPLPPWDAAEVVRRVRARLRRQRAIPVERLRDEAVGRFMISRWREAVATLDCRSRIPPRLQNTDGDELLLTKDHFELDPQGRGEAEARLAALEGIALSEQTENEHRYEFVRAGNAMHADWERTIVGLVRVREGGLVLETNSVARADHLRRRIEGACGGLVRHRLREHSDPRSMLARSRVPRDVPPLGDAPEAALIEREFKERHYQRWPDESLPALDGLTPREAVRTRPGRHRVDVLLKDMENHEGRLPAQHRFDFARLRRDLGLDS